MSPRRLADIYNDLPIRGGYFRVRDIADLQDYLIIHKSDLPTAFFDAVALEGNHAGRIVSLSTNYAYYTLLSSQPEMAYLYRFKHESAVALLLETYRQAQELKFSS